MKTKSTWLQIIIIYYYFKLTSTNQELKITLFYNLKLLLYKEFKAQIFLYFSKSPTTNNGVISEWPLDGSRYCHPAAEKQRTAEVHRYDMLSHSSIRSKLFIPIFHFLSWSTKVHPQRNSEMWTQTNVV